MALTNNEDAQQGIWVSENLMLVMNKNRTEVSINRVDDHNCCFIDIEVIDGKLEVVYHDQMEADILDWNGDDL